MMMVRLALRSLLAHPARSAVLAGGFGLGVSVMANLLGIGEVMLEQARSPALVGGGDVLIAGDFGEVQSARYLLSRVIAAPPFEGRGASRLPVVTVARLPGSRRRRGRPGTRRCARGGAESRAGARGWGDGAGVEAWIDTAA